MAGYNPAGPPPTPQQIFEETEFPTLPPTRNPFTKWNRRRRDKKADSRRAWMKFFSKFVYGPDKWMEFCYFVDRLTTAEVLDKGVLPPSIEAVLRRKKP